jgi:hypothetical protein
MASQDPETTPSCSASLPLTRAIIGLVSADWNCQSSFDWGLTAGAVPFGFEKWHPFAIGRLGVRYEGGGWQALGELGYAFLEAKAFDGLEELNPSHPIKSPSIQQWALLSESSVSVEFTTPAFSDDPTALTKSYGLQLWQALPSVWRTVGALRNTRTSDLNGINLLAHFASRNQRWKGSAGLGRMTASIDQVAVSFFYPVFELSYVFAAPIYNNSSSTTRSSLR